MAAARWSATNIGPGASNALGTGAVTLGGATLLLDNGVVLPNTVVVQQASFIDVNGTCGSGLAQRTVGQRRSRTAPARCVRRQRLELFRQYTAFWNARRRSRPGTLVWNSHPCRSCSSSPTAVTYTNPAVAGRQSEPRQGRRLTATVTGQIGERRSGADEKPAAAGGAAEYQRTYRRARRMIDAGIHCRSRRGLAGHGAGDNQRCDGQFARCQRHTCSSFGDASPWFMLIA